MGESTYYLGRIVKLGMLTTPDVIDAILAPMTLLQGRFEYTFTQAVRLQIGGNDVIYARLAKFLAKGEAKVVEPTRHEENLAEVPNLVVASSPFVFVPGSAGIAYQHIWNLLERSTFERTFPRLVEEKRQGFFVSCAIEPIADRLTFIRKLASIHPLVEVEATVNPPNPLFGPLWKSLRDYIRQRNAGELKIREKATSKEGLTSALGGLSARGADAQVSEGVKDAPLAIADAAVLMAADGYGTAKVRGYSGQRQVVVRTRDTQRHFRAEADPDPMELGRATLDHLSSADEASGLEHE